MNVDRSDSVKRDNDDDSSKPKKTQRKSGGPSLTKKEKAQIALTDAEQSIAIPKSLDTPKLVKKSIKKTPTEAKPLPLIRKRIGKKSKDPSFTKKEKAKIALAEAEQSMDIPKSISTTEEKRLNVLSNVIINSIKKSKKEKNCLL